MVVKMCQQQARDVGDQWGRQVATGGQEMRHLAKNPGAALRGAANHHRVCPGVCQHLACFFRRIDVAVGHHRNGQCPLDLGHGVVFSQAFVALLAGAAMHRHHLHASAFKQAGQHQRIFMVMCPAGAHLERHRHPMRAAGLDNGVHNLQRQRLVLHQRGASPFVAHFFGRTAHVDVDDLRTTRDVVDRCIRHHGGIGARNLHRDRLGLTFVVGAAGRLQAVPQIAPRRDHLADSIASTQLFAQPAKRPVRDTGHGRNKDVVRQNVRTDVHGQGGGFRRQEKSTDCTCLIFQQLKRSAVPVPILGDACKPGPNTF